MLDHKKVYNKSELRDDSKSEQTYTFSMLIAWSDRNFEFYSDFNLVSSSYTQ